MEEGERSQRVGRATQQNVVSHLWKVRNRLDPKTLEYEPQSLKNNRVRDGHGSYKVPTCMAVVPIRFLPVWPWFLQVYGNGSYKVPTCMVHTLSEMDVYNMMSSTCSGVGCRVVWEL